MRIAFVCELSFDCDDDAFYDSEIGLKPTSFLLSQIFAKLVLPSGYVPVCTLQLKHYRELITRL